MTISAIIVAAGRGERAGGHAPKQSQLLVGKPVFLWSIEAFQAHSSDIFCVLVVPPGQETKFARQVDPSVAVVPGGATRTESVKAGLAACAGDETGIVMIHDAARPGLTSDIITELIETMGSANAAAPALPVADALKRIAGDALHDVSRDGLLRVQTPQVFRHGEISAALEQHMNLVDDLAAIEQMNGTVKLINGHENLAKITYPEDLSRLERLLMPIAPAPRLGTGFDVHAFETGTQVTLCGVAIPHTHKLAGHSDADVAWHALTDAILGAAALGDIGDHFPPSDPQWKGAPSDLFLKHAVQAAATAGWQLTSCDLTVICEAPKVKPHREAMRQSTAKITGLPLDAVSVKATTTEGLGFTGRGEGIAAQASAVLSPLPSSA